MRCRNRPHRLHRFSGVLSALIFAAVLVAPCFALLSVVGASDAAAYRRSKTCLPDEEVGVVPTAIPRCDAGETPFSFFWPERTVPFYIGRDGCGEFQDADGNITADLERAIVQAFEVWNEPDCSDFEFVYGGQTQTNVLNAEDRSNLVAWRNPWPYGGAAFALTSVTTTLDGEIIDGDIELNSARYRFSIAKNPEAGLVDVRNTVTHEAGHVLGLAHSLEPEATMDADADLAETIKRTLHADDIEGLCAIYPPGVYAQGLSAEKVNGGCAHTGGGAPPTPPWLALAGLLLAGLLLARRRAKEPT